MKDKQFKLVIASGKGGVGKSMLTSALAMLFTKKKKIVVVDADVDAPNLAIWLNETSDENVQFSQKISTSFKAVIDREKCNGCNKCVESCVFSALELKNGRARLNPFLCEGCGVCQIVCPQKAIDLEPVENGQIKIIKTKYGFSLVTGQLFPGQSGSGKIVAEIKKQAEARGQYELMLIDSAPGTGCPVIASLQDANLVLLVTEPTPSGLTDLKRVLEVVKHFQIPFQLVINKWDINPQLSQKIEKEFAGNFLGKISYDQAIFKAIANLQPILETKLKAKKEIKEIFQKLIKIYGTS
jgi:MinD superfamily P-loop ATPase